MARWFVSQSPWSFTFSVAENHFKRLSYDYWWCLLHFQLEAFYIAQSDQKVLEKSKYYKFYYLLPMKFLNKLHLSYHVLQTYFHQNLELYIELKLWDTNWLAKSLLIIKTINQMSYIPWESLILFSIQITLNMHNFYCHLYSEVNSKRDRYR